MVASSQFFQDNAQLFFWHSIANSKQWPIQDRRVISIEAKLVDFHGEKYSCKLRRCRDRVGFGVLRELKPSLIGCWCCQSHWSVSHRGGVPFDSYKTLFSKLTSTLAWIYKVVRWSTDQHELYINFLFSNIYYSQGFITEIFIPRQWHFLSQYKWRMCSDLVN